jgi:hypothetical protein
MSRRKHRPSKASRPASRRYIDSAMRRLRDDVVRAVLWAGRPDVVEQMTQEQIERRLRGYGRGR